MASEPLFTVIESEDDQGDALIFTINADFADFKERAQYPWRLSVIIPYAQPEDGYPLQDEIEAMAQFENDLIGDLNRERTAHLLVRITARDYRQLIFFMDDDTGIEEYFTNMPDTGWDIDHDVERDVKWDSVTQLLQSAKDLS